MTGVNAAMAVGSIIVGQYYMTQINSQLKGINSELKKISSFQDRVYKSKVFALFGKVQEYSQFKMDIVENEEDRQRRLDHLENHLEYKCIELLGQANFALKEYEEKKALDYAEYEKLTFEAEKWYQYQKVLLKTLLKIEELIYTLNLGKISKDRCYSMFSPYNKQADDALQALKTWHKKTCDELKIDLDDKRRRRVGIMRYIMKVPAIFNDNLRYGNISKNTALMISHQVSDHKSVIENTDRDLFTENVRLVIKNGKLFYLPEVKTVGEAQESKSLQEADQPFKLVEDVLCPGVDEPIGDRFFVSFGDVSDSDISFGDVSDSDIGNDE